jgi:quercetin dioxygenase-like cupin family protein
MSCYHLYGDTGGETHLTPIDLPERDSYAGTVRGLTEIPVTTMGMGQFVGRKPDAGVHHAPRRQFLVVLEGELEILTTLGQRACLRPGDVLFADDIGTKGHVSRDVGDDPLMLMALAVQPEWKLPTPITN